MKPLLLAVVGVLLAISRADALNFGSYDGTDPLFAALYKPQEASLVGLDAVDVAVAGLPTVESAQKVKDHVASRLTQAGLRVAEDATSPLDKTLLLIAVRCESEKCDVEVALRQRVVLQRDHKVGLSAATWRHWATGVSPVQVVDKVNLFVEKFIVSWMKSNSKSD